MQPQEQDNHLAERARELIESDDSIRIEELRIKAHAGIVQLSGVTSDEGQKRRTEALARSVKGHAGITNDIQVRPSSARPVDSSQNSGRKESGGPPEGWAENDGRRSHRPRMEAGQGETSKERRDDWSSRFPDEIAGGKAPSEDGLERPRPNWIDRPKDPEPDPRPGDLPPGEIRS